MSDVKLFEFQQRILDDTAHRNRVAYYLDMGLGKTFVGAEKMDRLDAPVNLVICQKSKIDDWVEHFKSHYMMDVFDLTKPSQFKEFMTFAPVAMATKVGIINYELAFRRKDLRKLKGFTLMLDESSLIQNETAKRSNFILKRLKPDNVILLSGTPTGGRYEKLWSQCQMLGWDITKTEFWDRYIDYYLWDNGGWPVKIIKGYKNVERLKSELRRHGAVFMKTEEVMELPSQVFQTVRVKRAPEYKRFLTHCIVTLKDGTELVGDSVLKQRMYTRMLCGHYNPNKVEALRTLIQSTDDRMLIFYNYDGELDTITEVCRSEGRPVSVVNGHMKDLTNYEQEDNSITLIQYMAGSMGLNLQKANKTVYFTPPDGLSELFEQSKARTRRIGQERTCFYYYLLSDRTIEEEMYETLGIRKENTDNLFREGKHGRRETV